jgi:uncharacterized protein (DUF305 family)
MKTFIQSTAASSRWVGMLAFTLSALLAIADAPAPKRGQARYEVRFMTMMIDHHNMAIEMARLCEGRTVNPELQQMCEDVITAQTAEIADMQTWLNDWYGVQHEPMMEPKDERMLARLAALQGEEFERAFMPALIKHHSIALVRARQCQKRAFHEELIAMCQMMEEMQTAEITQLREWLCQWYQKCRRGNGG